MVPERKLIEGRLGAENVYKGHPSNVTDDAWKALFQCEISPRDSLRFLSLIRRRLEYSTLDR